MMRKNFGQREFATLGLMMVLGLVTGCGRNQDFLFDAGIKEPAQLKADQSSHKLLEMVNTNKLDILWVIDNSGSMLPHQQAVIQNTGLFMQQFAGQQSRLNWRMSLVSTDTADQPFLGMALNNLLDFSTVDPVGKFQAAVGKLGIDGSSTEMTYSPVLQALKNNPAFLRPESYLAIVVVTDEEEQSPIDTPVFLAELAKYKPLSQIQTFGIFSDVSLGCDGGAYLNSRYQDFIAATHGTVYPLCSPDFGKTLASIGSELGKLESKPIVQLTEKPVLGTIHISYHGREIPGGPKETGGFWRYEVLQNVIIFHDTSFVAGDLGDIQVDFQTEVVPETRRFSH